MILPIFTLVRSYWKVPVNSTLNPATKGHAPPARELAVKRFRVWTKSQSNNYPYFVFKTVNNIKRAISQERTCPYGIRLSSNWRAEWACPLNFVAGFSVHFTGNFVRGFATRGIPFPFPCNDILRPLLHLFLHLLICNLYLQLVFFSSKVQNIYV